MTGAAQRWTSRKLLFSMATVALASFLLWHGMIDKQTWEHVTIAVVGGYLASNVIQRATAKPETPAS